MEFRKIPFTCSYPPGKANVSILWVGYWVAFLVYAFAMANLESWMLKRPVRLIPFYLAVAIVFGFFRWWRRRVDRLGLSLIFDRGRVREFAVRRVEPEENLRRRGAHPNTSPPRAATNCRPGPKAAGTALPPQCRSSQPYNC